MIGNQTIWFGHKDASPAWMGRSQLGAKAAIRRDSKLGGRTVAKKRKAKKKAAKKAKKKK
jgi:hypothetical protein